MVTAPLASATRMIQLQSEDSAWQLPSEEGTNGQASDRLCTANSASPASSARAWKLHTK